MLWVAFVAVFAMDTSTLWCDVLSFNADLSLHGLEYGRLHPPGSVAFGRFLRQEVQIIGCLGGQAHCNDGFSIPHGTSEVEHNNKQFYANLDRGVVVIGRVGEGVSNKVDLRCWLGSLLYTPLECGV